MAVPPMPPPTMTTFSFADDSDMIEFLNGLQISGV